MQPGSLCFWLCFFFLKKKFSRAKFCLISAVCLRVNFLLSGKFKAEFRSLELFLLHKKEKSNSSNVEKIQNPDPLLWYMLYFFQKSWFLIFASAGKVKLIGFESIYSFFLYKIRSCPNILSLDLCYISSTSNRISNRKSTMRNLTVDQNKLVDVLSAFEDLNIRWILFNLIWGYHFCIELRIKTWENFFKNLSLSFEKVPNFGASIYQLIIS